MEVLPLKDAMSEAVPGLVHMAEDWDRGGVHTSVNGRANCATPRPWELEDLASTCCICLEPKSPFQDEEVLRDWEGRFHIFLNCGVLCIGLAAK